MLPRMIDIARAKLPGGVVGEYQIARAKDEKEVMATVPGSSGQTDHSKLSSFLNGLTVADVPDTFKAEFERFYGKNLPAGRLVLDVLEEDDARSFPRKPESGG